MILSKMTYMYHKCSGKCRSQQSIIQVFSRHILQYIKAKSVVYVSIWLSVIVVVFFAVIVNWENLLFMLIHNDVNVNKGKEYDHLPNSLSVLPLHTHTHTCMQTHTSQHKTLSIQLCIKSIYWQLYIQKELSGKGIPMKTLKRKITVLCAFIKI